MPGLAQSTLCRRSSGFEEAEREDLETQVSDYRIIRAFITRLAPHSNNCVYFRSSITCPSPPASMHLNSAYRRGNNPYRSVVSGGSDARCDPLLSHQPQNPVVGGQVVETNDDAQHPTRSGESRIMKSPSSESEHHQFKRESNSEIYWM